MTAAVARRLTAKCLGIAICDHLDGREIEAIDWSLDDLGEDWPRHLVAEVDVSDAETPIVHVEGGQRFRIRIEEIK